MDTVKKHFEEEANEFDKIILRLIPYYSKMLDGLVAAIPHDKSDGINVIDLGCGTGTISRMLKESFPRSMITCLDLAENMIEMAKIKLAEYRDIRYQVGNFYDYDFNDSYDVIISSLALHHLVTEEDKKHFYRKIYNALNPGGVFLNADVVLGSNRHLQSMYMQKWIEFMKCHISEDEIEGKWLQKYHEEDHPAKLVDHLAWLSEIGFSGIDVVWKYYNFAVYGACKPTCSHTE